MLNTTPFGTLVVFFAIVGVASLMAWITVMVDQLLNRAIPKVKEWLVKRGRNRALRRLLKSARPMTDQERQVMHQGAQEALEAFKRAQVAMASARR